MEYTVKGKFQFDDSMVTPTDVDGVFQYDFVIDLDEEPDTDDIRMALGYFLRMFPETTNDSMTIVGEAGLRPGDE